MKPLKVLCLHGYRQNETKFRSQTGALRKILKKHIDMTFISAPHIIPGEPPEEDQRSWWFTVESGTFSSKDESEVCFGFQETISLLVDVFSNQGPFQGILGFSQGACLVSLLASMRQRGELPKAVDFQFVVLFSGFRSRCKQHLEYYTDTIKEPSLHIYGASDQIIDSTWSEELTRDFENPFVIKHEGGHFVPGNKNLQDSYIEFFNTLKIS